jgi:hypothetical protein
LVTSFSPHSSVTMSTLTKTCRLAAPIVPPDQLEQRKVRVVIRKRASTKLQSVDHKILDMSPTKLIDYKNRLRKSRVQFSAECNGAREKRPSSNKHVRKQIRFDESMNSSLSPNHELTTKVMEDAFYSADDIEKMMRYHHRLAERSLSSASRVRNHDDLRGLEEFMGATALAAANSRKLQYLQAVLQEQARQRQEGVSCPDELRKRARAASKTSRTMALQLGQQDAQYNDSSSARPSHQSARVRSKSICGPIAIAPMAVAPASDRRSRRSNSMRVSVRTAPVVM